MTESIILKDFQVQYDDQELLGHFRIKSGTRAEKQFKEVLATAKSLAQPKAAVLVMSPEILDEEHVRFGEIVFKSNLMCRQLTGLTMAFPHVATCGQELAEWTASLKGLEQFMADELMLMALRQGVQQLEDYLAQRFNLPMVSAMNPGSLPKEWPIKEQSPLFKLIGHLAQQIGVFLLPSLLMNPGKSVSGVYFETAKKYHNCQLCTKDNCPSRKDEYQGENLSL
jgi:hypothetical protein